MEDAHTTVLDLLANNADASKNHPQRLSFFGVFDGHGGDKVALFTGENIHNIISKQDTFKAGNYEQALKDGFLATDRAILNGTADLTFPPPRGAYMADKCFFVFLEQTPNTRRRFLAAQPVSVSLPTTKSTLYVPPRHFSPPGECFKLTRRVRQANAGDSRSVLGVKGRAKPLSFDHKPQNEGVLLS